MQKNITRSKKFFFLILLVFAIMPFLSLAQGQNTNNIVDISLPGTTATNNLPTYINNLYRFGIVIAGILAVGMIVAGAIYISVSSGSPDKQSEGKDMITQAAWGLLLLFGSYLILRTINPELVKLKGPKILSSDEIARLIQSCAGVERSASLTAPEIVGGKVVKVGPCGKNQPPINENTGQCQCFIEEPKCPDRLMKQNSDSAICPRSLYLTEGLDSLDRQKVKGVLPKETGYGSPGKGKIYDAIVAGVTNFVKSSGELSYLFYDEEEQINANSKIWMYPFFIPNTPQNQRTTPANLLGPENAQCLIYARKEPSNTGFLGLGGSSCSKNDVVCSSYDDVARIDLKNNLEKCK